MEKRAFLKRMLSSPYPVYGWTQEWIQHCIPRAPKTKLARLSTQQYTMSEDLHTGGAYLEHVGTCMPVRFA